MSNANVILLLLVLLAANLPWFSNKFFYLINLPKNNKHFGWCLLELIILYFFMGAIARYTEQQSFGQLAPQAWEFYAVTGCLFLVFAFPGFVYKYLWR